MPCKEHHALLHPQGTILQHPLTTRRVRERSSQLPSPLLYTVLYPTSSHQLRRLPTSSLERLLDTLPLSWPQVNYPRMSPAVLEAAQRLSGGKARPAVELLQYDAKMAPAVHYAFGNVFICQVRAVQSQFAFVGAVARGACPRWAWSQDLANAHTVLARNAGCIVHRAC